MKEILTILVSAILVENFVLSKFMGICPFLGVSKKLSSAMGMSLAVIFVMVISTAVTYPIFQYFLVPNDLTYLNTIVFILVIAAMVQLVDFVLKRFLPSLHESLGVYLPLITTNCAVLGVTLLNVSSENILNFGHAIANAFGAGLGFMLAMVLFAGVRGRIENNSIPKRFQGLPITLVAASIVSVIFLGFKGIV